MPKARNTETVAAEATEVPAGEPIPTVDRVVLESQYGFWTDDEPPLLRMWHPGQEVTDPDEIELLISREAPVTIYGSLE
ncbi:MAG: hypothetical protein ACK4MG_04170 [Aquabacterium sp.]|uniref:hypothetical protein n=1 Tax=uncultured Aquabacterium sp. TaxID=158753 RepID=UPI0025E70F54|nr:hypothetical protein [uncultured Aquabacterium sp.]